MLIIELFKDIITRSYGEKSPDGRRFIKNKEVLENFTQTAAYSELYMELAFNTEAAKKFINGVIPESININIPSDNNIHALPGSAPVDGVILPK